MHNCRIDAKLQIKTISMFFNASINFTDIFLVIKLESDMACTFGAVTFWFYFAHTERCSSNSAFYNSPYFMKLVYLLVAI